MEQGNKYIINFKLVVFLLIITAAASFGSESAQAAGFIIADGVLTGYDGTDTNITIPSDVTRIGDEAFDENLSIISVTIPANVQEIGNASFSGCSNLETVKFAEGLKTIEDSAFQDCVKIKELELPESVEQIGAWTFMGCSALQKISLPSGINTIEESLFQDCVSLETITIPGNVEVISDWAFYGCTGLKEIITPEALKEIGDGAFQDCTSLKEITLHKNVAIIGDNAFDNCTSLEKIMIYADNVELGEDIFKGCKDTMQIYGNENTSVMKALADRGFSFHPLPESANTSSNGMDTNEIIRVDGVVYRDSMADGNVITVSKKKIIMTKGKKSKITAKSSQGLAIVYKSLHTDKVTVNGKGVLKAKKAGRAVIEITSGQSKLYVRVTIKSRITENTVMLKKNIKLSKSKIIVKKGQKVIIDTDAVRQKVTFKSSNKQIANVSVKGVVKAKKKGKTVILVKCKGKTVKLNITVKKK